MKKKLHLVLALAAALAGMPLAAHAASAPIPATADSDDNQYEPDEVSNLEVNWNILEECFDISFTAPTRSSYYDYDLWENVYADLTSIEKITVEETSGSEPKLLHTFTNPTPGDKLSFKESSLARGGTYVIKVTVYANGLRSYGTSKYGAFAGAVPDKVNNVTVSTVQGQMPITVKFTTPSTYFDGKTALPSLEKVVLSYKKGYWDPEEELSTLTSVEPGKEYSMVVSKEGLSGAATWNLTAYNSDGASAATEVKVYVGTDAPGLVNNLTAVEQEDGKIKLSWSAPTSGANNGYFPAEGLKYTVMLKTPGTYTDNSTVIAQDLTECAYTYDGGFTEPTKLRFAVKAIGTSGNGPETNTGYLIAGPANKLPFAETFDKYDDNTYSYVDDNIWGASTTSTESYTPEWRGGNYAYFGQDKAEPEGGQGAFKFINFYASTQLADYNYSSSKIDVSEAPSLELSYLLFNAANSARGETSLSASISFDGGQTFKTVQTNLLAELPAPNWNKITVKPFAVPDGAKTAILRFTAKNDPCAMGVAIDNINLKAGQELPDIYAAAVTDFAASYNKADKQIEISLTAPTTTHATLGDKNGEPLTEITAIKLSRQITGVDNDYVLVHTFNNPAPGAKLTWNDTDLAKGGEYHYRAVVYVDDKGEYGNFLDSPVTVGQIPADATDLNIFSTLGSAPVVVEFVLPTLDAKGETLDEVTSAAITRYNTTTFAWDEVGRLTEDLTPGKKCHFEDANVASGAIYEYRVVVYGTAGNSYGVSGSVFVGADQPVEPTNLKAVLNEDGKVVLTWDAPTAGINNGYIDTAHLTYTVQRGNGYSDYDAIPLKSGITETTFTDDTTFGEEEIVKYFVKATSQNITGYSAISNTLVVGSPSSLPYKENFETQVGDNIQADHTSWTLDGTDGTTNWAFAEQAYFVLEGIATPVDGGKGLAYAHYGHYSEIERDDYLTSGNINVEGQNELALSFHLYAVPDYNTSLDVKVAFDGGEFTSVRQFHYDRHFDKEGWMQYSLPVTVPADAKKMRMQFHAHKGTYACSVAIDNILVDTKTDGINDVEVSDKGALVAAIDGAIVVNGAADSTPVMVFSLSGMTIYSGTGSCTVPVAPGTYLVKVGSATVKLLVK